MNYIIIKIPVSSPIPIPALPNLRKSLKGKGKRGNYSGKEKDEGRLWLNGKNG